MKLGGLLKSLAPTIANAAGGPLAGMAVKIAASKLGLPSTATANEIEDLIEREPDKAVSMRFKAVGQSICSSRSRCETLAGCLSGAACRCAQTSGTTKSRLGDRCWMDMHVQENASGAHCSQYGCE